MTPEEMSADALEKIQEQKTLPDFRVNFNNRFNSDDFVTITNYDGQGSIATVDPKDLAKKKGKKAETKIEITPKGLYALKVLNSPEFSINIEEKYINEQLKNFKDRLSVLKLSEGDYRNGLIELASMLIRLENRKQYSKFKEFFDQYPYTTNAKIDESMKAHTHLQLGLVQQFVPSLPKEAIDAMKEYNKQINKLCKKEGVFYIIAKKEDFQRTNKRKDPILLAQSPFGHFWQIIGAWDEEMILLDEL